MLTATKILIIAGVLHYAYSFITGAAMGYVRLSEPAVPKYLTYVHVGAFMNGSMLLATTVALEMSPIAERTETWVAILLVAGAILLALKDTVNWLLKVEDDFREKRRPYGFIIGNLSALSSTTGLVILIVGVLRGI